MEFRKYWTDSEGNCDGGISSGLGYTIAWQRGSSRIERNGAVPIEILKATRERLIYFQSTKHKCQENIDAIANIEQAISSLEKRHNNDSIEDL